MQAEQTRLIERHWSKLVDISEIQDLAKTLVDNGIYSSVEFNNIFSGDDERANRERFFNTLLEKEEEAYNTLVRWLSTSNHNNLACKLAAKGSGHGPKPYKPPFEEGEEESDTEIESSIETGLPPTSPTYTTVDESRAPLKVNVCLANEFCDTTKRNPNMPFYMCRSKKRGRVLIINNYEFPNTSHKTRTGAHVDEENLKHLFDQMGGWDIKVKSNKTAQEMKDTLKSFTKEKREKRCDVCFVFIMSHGSDQLNETIIYGTDGKYLTTTQIHRYFTNEKCALYRGKPKVFIYQVCRGNELDFRKSYSDKFTQFDGKRRDPNLSIPIPQEPISYHFRPVEDMLIGYATMQGSKAHRDTYRGTWYIELICKHFMELSRCESVDDLLVKVDEGLRKRMSELGTVQTAEHISKGFKKLYLNPGIYEEGGKVTKFFDSIL